MLEDLAWMAKALKGRARRGAAGAGGGCAVRAALTKK